jgi:hypothetical protein
MAATDDLRVSNASHLAAAVRRVNVAYEAIGSPQIRRLDQLWNVLGRELDAAEQAGDEVMGRQAIDLYERTALDCIRRHR